MASLEITYTKRLQEGRQHVQGHRIHIPFSDKLSIQQNSSSVQLRTPVYVAKYDSERFKAYIELSNRLEE